MTGPLFFIVNLKAGAGRTARLWPRLKRRIEERGLQFRAAFCHQSQEAPGLVKAAPEGFIPVVVGGDTTLHEAVKGLPPNRPIGVIPTGRENDFARSLGISPYPLVALEQLSAGEHRLVDLPYANDAPFLGVAGIGLPSGDSLRPGAGRSGLAADLMRGVKLVFRHQPVEVSIDVDGLASSGSISMMAVGNGRTFRGGLRVCPQAHMDDGLFDVCVAEALGPGERILSHLHLRYGSHIRRRKIHYFKAHTVRVAGPSDLAVVADGCVLGRLPVTFTLKQRSLGVIVPQGAWGPSKVRSIRSRRLAEGSCETTR